LQLKFSTISKIICPQNDATTALWLPRKQKASRLWGGDVEQSESRGLLHDICKQTEEAESRLIEKSG
jgi:hypothetical protein